MCLITDHRLTCFINHCCWLMTWQETFSGASAAQWFPSLTEGLKKKSPRRDSHLDLWRWAADSLSDTRGDLNFWIRCVEKPNVCSMLLRFNCSLFLAVMSAPGSAVRRIPGNGWCMDHKLDTGTKTRRADTNSTSLTQTVNQWYDNGSRFHFTVFVEYYGLLKSNILCALGFWHVLVKRMPWSHFKRLSVLKFPLFVLIFALRPAPPFGDRNTEREAKVSE